ncbi:hypothetical protein JCGZ_15218 [Jatropha curcas]|uniref:Late embryogenesis abundant protein LEA-2 subgroup domain-containing protein n=2 Tax=Jatropha curcas TaxID=180498 RepID=A0A067K6B0_JATCU|nr:hypothetical protein JCGZ_15218 [Jatropha curcas]
MDHLNNLPNSSSYTFGPQPQPQTLQINNSEADGPRSNYRLRSLDDCVPRLMLVLIMLFLILSFVCAIAWLVIDPQDPSFGLHSLSISNITLSDSRFAAYYEMEFDVNNTNDKANLAIDQVNVAVLYGKAIVSEKDLEEIMIFVPKMSQRKMKVVLDMESVRPVGDVFKDLSDDWSKKIVNFNVEMPVRSTYQVGAWPSKKRFFKVRCRELVVEFLSSKGTGKVMNARKSCSLQHS